MASTRNLNVASNRLGDLAPATGQFGFRASKVDLNQIATFSLVRSSCFCSFFYVPSERKFVAFWFYNTADGRTDPAVSAQNRDAVCGLRVTRDRHRTLSDKILIFLSHTQL